MRSVLLAACALAAMIAGATAQDGPGRSEVDTSGKGAILCSWAILVEVEVLIDVCDLPPRPGDVNLAPSISRVERFILENTTHGITQAWLDRYKEDVRRRRSSWGRGVNCPESANSLHLVVDNLVEGTDNLLSVPREPVWNPCF